MKKALPAVAALALIAILTLSAASCTSKKAGTQKPTGKQTQPQPTKPTAQNTTGLPLALPAGVTISFFAQNLGGPRVLIFDTSGNLLVSNPSGGSVLALPDRDNNGVADSTVTVASGLNNPHGLAFSPTVKNKIYIAETDQVATYDYDPAAMKATNKQKIIDLPSGGGHFTRTIMFMPPPNQKKLLISVGSSANVTDEMDWRRAKILVANADGSGLAPFASGLRNAVFMTVQPRTREVWATENGRDLLGDNIPPDEINIIKQGSDYGWPTFYGKNVHDTQFDTKTYTGDPSAGKTPSYIDIPAHSAPLGLAFFTSKGWPQQYANDLLVAYHGSWNRSAPTGYKIVRVRLNAKGGFIGIEDFITGWLQPDGTVLGRPVDILFSGNGTAFVSDDNAGVIYRVANGGQ